MANIVRGGSGGPVGEHEVELLRQLVEADRRHPRQAFHYVTNAYLNDSDSFIQHPGLPTGSIRVRESDFEALRARGWIRASEAPRRLRYERRYGGRNIVFEPKLDPMREWQFDVTTAGHTFSDARKATRFDRQDRAG